MLSHSKKFPAICQCKPSGTRCLFIQTGYIVKQKYGDHERKITAQAKDNWILTNQKKKYLPQVISTENGKNNFKTTLYYQENIEKPKLHRDGRKVNR